MLEFIIESYFSIIVEIKSKFNDENFDKLLNLILSNQD
jgi:hypothetical protein